MATPCLAVNTDYVKGTGCAEEYLRAAAAAGFTHLHWCHQWNTDFLYGAAEIAQIKAWLDECSLQLLDVHGPVGPEKNWYSLREYERLAGVELVANRLRMLAELGGTGVVMMHAPVIKTNTTPEEADLIWQKVTALKKSLRDLRPVQEETGVPIAIENLSEDKFEVMAEIFAEFPAPLIGLCYDSGHGNMGEGRGLEYLAEHQNRLIALHLHDNDGSSDQHQPPLMGSVDWSQLSDILATSSYRRQLSFEITMRYTPFTQEAEFLQDAWSRCDQVLQMVRKAGWTDCGSES